MPNFGPRLNMATMSQHDVLAHAHAYSMVSRQSIHNAFDLCMFVQRNNIPGCFVECGTWRGGCVVTMAYAAACYVVSQKGEDVRKTWGFDSFEGLPDITEKDGKPGYKKGALAVPIENVDRTLFWTFGLKRENVFLVKGWFNESLPRCKHDMGPIAVLRLDGDWYESTMTALTNLYDQVSPGGYVIIDDYGAWPGCRKASNEFFISRGWLSQDFAIDGFAPWLTQIENGGYFFGKTPERE